MMVQSVAIARRCFSLAACCCAIVWLAAPTMAQPPAVSPHSLVPEKEITVKGQPVPEWKIAWDEARRLSIAGMYDAAIKRYERLLKAKPGVKEARWELARLFMHLKRWNDAAALLELLLEDDPDRTDYLNGIGRVMWETGHFERAVDLFQRAYDLDNTNQTALAGLVEGLVKLERREEALSMAEALHRLTPDTPGINRYLALLTFELGQYDRARTLLVPMAALPDADLEVLTRTAQVHDRLGLASQAASYWQRVLARDPGNGEAHARLADFHESAGRAAQALPHLLAQLPGQENNGPLLARIAEAYRNNDQADLALPYYQRYLQLHPADPRRLRAVFHIYAASGDRPATLMAWKKYFAAQPDADPADLRLAAQLYDAAGRYHEALPLYSRLIDIAPENPEVLTALVNDLLAIGDNDGALSRWRQLAEVAPYRLSAYRSIAGLLVRLGRKDELVDALVVIHKLAPGDEAITLQLADQYHQQGKLDAALRLYAKVEASGPRGSVGQAGYGEVLETLGRPTQALTAYERALQLDPTRIDIRMRCVRLAGTLGRITVVRNHLDQLALASGMNSESSRQLRFDTAEAFRIAGLLPRAVTEFRGLLQDIEGDVLTDQQSMPAPLQCRAWRGMATAYQDQGRTFEAEQILRQGLQQDNGCRSDLLEALFDMTIAARRPDEAAMWLTTLQASDSSTATRPTVWQQQLWAMRLHAARDDIRAAIRVGRGLLATLADENPDNGVNQPLSPRCRVGLELARIYVDDNRPDQAGRLAETLAGMDCRGQELLVLLEQINDKADLGIQTDAVKALLSEKSDAADLMRRAELHRRHGDAAALYANARAALELIPDSVYAQLLLADGLRGRGRLEEALTAYQTILQQIPGNSRAESAMTELLLRTDRLKEGLTLCDTMLAAEPRRGDIVLLKARMLWAMRRWDDAIAVYRDFLSPDVASILQQQLKTDNLLPDLDPRQTLWNRITFTKGRRPDLTEMVMSISHVASEAPEDQQRNRLVVPLFARYRWAEWFALELRARQAVRQREYYHAAGLYEQLLATTPTDESLLFDLAGVYSRLGRLAQESAAYDQLHQLNAGYPGLAESVTRNRLKRRPRTTLAYGMREDDGWDTYKSRKKEWLEAAIRVAPSSRHEFDLSAAQIIYQSTSSDKAIWSKRAMLNYRTGIAPGLSLGLGAGVEDVEQGLARTALLQCSLLGKLGDALSGKLTYSRDVTDDTLASLTRNITRNTAEAGITVDLVSRLQVGGEYGHTEYSDGNRIQRYSIWSSYFILPEPFHLSVSYTYDYENALKENLPGVALPDGFGPADHPYWSPVNYWLSVFSVTFRHQLDQDTLDRVIPKYYMLRYSFGYDSRDYDLQALEGGFFVEITDHVIARASAKALSLQNFQSKEAWLSLTYRW